MVGEKAASRKEEARAEAGRGPDLEWVFLRFVYCIICANVPGCTYVHSVCA